MTDPQFELCRPLPDIAQLSKEFYCGLNQHQIEVLVRFEAMAMCYMHEERPHRLYDAFREADVVFDEKAVRLYGAMAESVGHFGTAAEWYKMLFLFTQDRKPLIHLCLRAGLGYWSNSFISTFAEKLIALKMLLPYLMARLESARRWDCKPALEHADFELAVQMRELDGGASAKLAACLLLKPAIRSDKAKFKEYLKELGRSMNRTEQRLHLSRLVGRANATFRRDAPESGQSVAHEIVRLGMSSAFGPRLIKCLLKQKTTLQDLEEILQILSLPLCEEDLLKLHDIHQRSETSIEELVSIARKLVQMNAEHAPRLQEALQTARQRSLGSYLVRDAHRYGNECGQPLTIQELRTQLFIFYEWNNPDNFHNFVPEQTFARQELARLLHMPGSNRRDRRLPAPDTPETVTGA